MRRAAVAATFCRLLEDRAGKEQLMTDMTTRFPVRHADFSTGQRRPACAMVGASLAWQSVMHRVDQVASTNATVLLLGETGTGKDLLARAIHERSARRTRNLVVVDCGALPSSLFESELFGRERGAFTGAHTSQAGRFEAAHGGTVFLDEIGELPLELQPKLLRVIQEGEVERLGGQRTTQVDVRIIAATNRLLADEVREKRFRPDLFYRLNVFPITVPPLRDRRDDLPALVRHFIDRLSVELDKPIERMMPGSLDALARHDWPGNIRELENTLRRAIILARDGVLDLSHFVGEAIQTHDAKAIMPGGVRPLADAERDHVTLVLAHTGWRIEGAAGAAKMLGLNPSTLRSRMRKLGIERHRGASGTQDTIRWQGRSLATRGAYGSVPA
jgi:formate hydrogenlyase transcriptional activator